MLLLRGIAFVTRFAKTKHNHTFFKFQFLNYTCICGGKYSLAKFQLHMPTSYRVIALDKLCSLCATVCNKRSMTPTNEEEWPCEFSVCKWLLGHIAIWTQTLSFNVVHMDSIVTIVLLKSLQEGKIMNFQLLINKQNSRETAIKLWDTYCISRDYMSTKIFAAFLLLICFLVSLLFCSLIPKIPNFSLLHCEVSAS